MSTKEQISYFNNLKAFLIFSVAIGHFLLVIIGKCGNITAAAFYYIYLFNMPAFVFTTGYFAKNYVKKSDYERAQKLWGYLLLFILFQGALLFTKYYFTHQFLYKKFIFINGAPWYLLCTFFWMLIIPVFRFFRPWAGISMSIVIAVGIGFIGKFSIFLSLSRCFCFFPFFLMGYYVSEESIRRIRTRPLRIASFAGLAMAAGIVYLYLPFIKKHSAIIYANKPYSTMNTSELTGAFLRLGWYAVAVMLIFLIIEVIPEDKYFFTYMGKNTLGIYIFHRIVRECVVYTGFYGIASSPEMKVVMAILLSVICCFVFGLDVFNKPLKKLFKLDFSLIMDRKQ